MRRTSLVLAVLIAGAMAAPSAASAASWSAQAPVDPAGSTGSQLAGTACPSTTSCIAVGNYDDGSGVTLPLVERWNGSAWSQGTAAAPPTGHNGGNLAAVGCSGSSACTAVGSYFDASFDQWALVQRWNGTSWSAQSFIRPAGALATSLAGVQCPTSTSCLAVGNYVDGAGVSQPLAARWNGTSWAQLTVPGVAGAISTSLSAISCTTSTGCTAVGSYVDGSGTPLPMSVRWNGSSWSLTSVPAPTGAAATFLTGISCTSGSACTTVGYATDSLGAIFAVAERWNGTAWSQQTLAALPLGSTGSALLGVSCTSATHCSAVGYHLDATGTSATLAEGWNGSAWSLQTTPNPAGSLGAAAQGVSCNSSSVCESVGYFMNAGGLQRTLAQRWS